MILLNNLAQLIDKAIIIRSKNINIKQQEEILRTSGMKNELLEEVLNAYNTVLDQTLENCIQDMEGDNKLGDGEERGRAKTSLLKLSEMLDKGMQIYTAIDSPKKIQVLFPKEEKYESLGGDIIKLLESK